MTSSPLRTLALAAAATLTIGAAVLSTAHSQPLVQVAPNFVPIGVASNGSSSTAWFHETSTGRAMACTTAPTAGGLSPIQCVTTKLPRAEP